MVANHSQSRTLSELLNPHGPLNVEVENRVQRRLQEEGPIP